ncbi:TetR/AcrR family transcriptional regulator [Streptomyces pactum]|uniref:TetR/AcrR family transcriptional regulator n=1 Tax=Streptomyces pactum TaxID=68249 RepID=A0ABS0NFY0_9ACTN|nr:TetR/AcrR family transcriptional regulator [Streptomyces pactum]MBH5334092.1 TetR/AcrR family transcriptional regulator [Streptomyces pactum]
METAELTTRVLDAAEALFYRRGVQSVGMDAVRGAAQVSLKRLYQLFPSKEALVRAYLLRRDERWRADLARHVERRPAGTGRVLAVFDRLDVWFREPDFRGCAFINSFGELGATSEPVAEAARAHQRAVRAYLEHLVTEAGLPAAVAAPLFLLVQGAITAAAVGGGPEPARQAEEAARTLLAAAAAGGPPPTAADHRPVAEPAGHDRPADRLTG